MFCKYHLFKGFFSNSEVTCPERNPGLEASTADPGKWGVGWGRVWSPSAPFSIQAQVTKCSASHLKRHELCPAWPVAHPLLPVLCEFSSVFVPSRSLP